VAKVIRRRPHRIIWKLSLGSSGISTPNMNSIRAAAFAGHRLADTPRYGNKSCNSSLFMHSTRTIYMYMYIYFMFVCMSVCTFAYNSRSKEVMDSNFSEQLQSAPKMVSGTKGLGGQKIGTLRISRHWLAIRHCRRDCWHYGRRCRRELAG